MPYATKMSICKIQLVQSGCYVLWSHWIPIVILQKEIPWRLLENSFVMFGHWKTLTGECRRLGDFRTHIWATLSWFLFWISSVSFASWLCLENIYCMNSFIRKNQLDICPKQEIKKSLLFSIQLYSILVHWNESQPLNTFSRDFLLNQISYEHSGYGDIVFGDDKVTSKDRVCSQMPHGLVKAKGIRNFGITKRSNRGVCPVLWKYVFYLLTLSTEVRGSFMNAVLGCVILWHVWDFPKK